MERRILSAVRGRYFRIQLWPASRIPRPACFGKFFLERGSPENVRRLQRNLRLAKLRSQIPMDPTRFEIKVRTSYRQCSGHGHWAGTLSLFLNVNDLEYHRDAWSSLVHSTETWKTGNSRCRERLKLSKRTDRLCILLLPLWSRKILDCNNLIHTLQLIYSYFEWFSDNFYTCSITISFW